MNKRAKSFQRAFQPNVWTEVLSDITQNIKCGVKIVGKTFWIEKKLFKPHSKTISEFNDGLERLTVGFLHIKHQNEILTSITRKYWIFFQFLLKPYRQLSKQTSQKCHIKQKIEQTQHSAENLVKFFQTIYKTECNNTNKNYHHLKLNFHWMPSIPHKTAINYCNFHSLSVCMQKKFFFCSIDVDWYREGC